MLFVFAYVDILGFWRQDVIRGALHGQLPDSGPEAKQAFLALAKVDVLVPSIMVAASLLAPAASTGRRTSSSVSSTSSRCSPPPSVKAGPTTSSEASPRRSCSCHRRRRLALAPTVRLMTVLVAYVSRHGATESIAARIATRLADSGAAVDLRRVDEVEALDVYDAVVFGAPVYAPPRPTDTSIGTATPSLPDRSGS